MTTVIAGIACIILINTQLTGLFSEGPKPRSWIGSTTCAAGCQCHCCKSFLPHCQVHVITCDVYHLPDLLPGNFRPANCVVLLRLKGKGDPAFPRLSDVFLCVPHHKHSSPGSHFLQFSECLRAINDTSLQTIGVICVKQRMVIELFR